MSGFLDGVRVLDLSRLLPGPFATKLLQDMGAQVDKLEDPRGGDYLRFMPPHDAKGRNVAFDLLNRGKRSIVLDLKSDEGRGVFLKLLPHYDVLLESFRPGVMERLGLGRDALDEAHASLITCAISGYGQDGPLRERACHDLNCLGRAGVLGFFGPVDGPPQVPGVQLADIGGGLFAALAIVAALRKRDHGGGGARLDISMTEAAASFAAFGFAGRAIDNRSPRGQEVLTGGLAVYNTYETSDGRYVSLACLEPKFWKAFCEGVGYEGKASAMMPGDHQVDLKRDIAEILRGRTRDEWAAFGEAHDCCLEPILDPSEVLADAQLKARGLFGVDTTHLATPCAAAATGPAPAQGEHTSQILTEFGIDAG